MKTAWKQLTTAAGLPSGFVGARPEKEALLLS
jgi:hypothetical protein